MSSQKTADGSRRAAERSALPAVLAALLLLAGCGNEDPAGGGEGGDRAARGRQGGGEAPPWAAMAGGEPTAAVPVEIAPVERRQISSFIETNGTLEAENEVDIVARVSAPIVYLGVEEGMAVRKGQILARLEDDEIRSQVDVARVNLDEARQVYERAKRLKESQLISPEEYDQASTRFETARAELEGREIQLGYTTIRAPFNGLIVNRYIDLAQQVSPNTPLFRISDFDPLLCPIQVPERELPLLSEKQRAYLTVEAWSGERFAASVLRISPVVNAATGTVKVTLEVEAEGKLRPGMFARVYLETATKPDALVIPKAALSLESIGDTVYVADGAVARRREVTLGYQEGDFVEAVDGLEAGDQVVVVGQDGLSDGTPIRVLGPTGGEAAPRTARGGSPDGSDRAPPESDASTSGPPGGFDPSRITPEMLERFKQRMRERGMTEEQIEERIRQLRERQGGQGS